MPSTRTERLAWLAMPAARIAPVALAGVAGIALLAGCGSAADGSTSSTPAGAPSSAASSASAPSDGGSSASASPESAATASPEASASASVPEDPAYTLADAIVDQLGTTDPARLSDELVTIAVSPQLRQVAASYGVTTSIDVKGARVILTITGEELGKTLTCEVTVADAPNAARGFVCK